MVNKAILFLNIQTVSQAHKYAELEKEVQQFWEEKNQHWLSRSGLSPEEGYALRGSMQAEFGRICAIGMGFAGIANARVVRWREVGLSEADEKSLLRAFLQELPKGKHYTFCSHHGREFAYPFLCRRLLAHQLELPERLDIRMKKPWECAHLEDTHMLWRFGDHKHYTSLRLLCHALNLPLLDCEIREKDVAEAFYEKKDYFLLKKLSSVQVCHTLRVYLRLKQWSDATDPLPSA